MDLEILLKAIVPLSFLAIWALTAVFNKQSQPLPTRVPSSNPFGPRPAPPTPLAPSRPVSTVRNEPPIRWGSQTVAPPPPPRLRPGGDDEIVILEMPRLNRPTGRGVSPSKKSKANPAANKPTPKPSANPGFGKISQTVNQQLTGAIHHHLLAESVASTVTHSVAGTAAKSIVVDIADQRLASLVATMRDPARLREAFVLNELLQPPLSMRGRPRRAD